MRKKPWQKRLTPDRAERLTRLLQCLMRGPCTRADVLKRLKVTMRGFYRDLESLKRLGVEVDSTGGLYQLDKNSRAAMDRLPFPDPELTLGEARQLAKGSTPAHKKLQRQLAGFAS